MPQPCSLCIHPQRDAIDREELIGELPSPDEWNDPIDWDTLLEGLPTLDDLDIERPDFDTLIARLPKLSDLTDLQGEP